MNQYLINFIDKNFKSPGKALDLGAGEFVDIKHLKELGWEAEGVDINMGVDLENPYMSDKAPFDLVYSNYVLQKIKNQRQFIKSVFNNLKGGGYLFITTFDESDKISRNGVVKEKMFEMLKSEGFISIEMEVFPHYDSDVGHNHWHQVLQISAKKEV